MSAAIRIKIIGGTDISEAYHDCKKVSFLLGGISVETSFNGVEMFYYRQTLVEWRAEYKKRIFGLSNEGRQENEHHPEPYDLEPLVRHD